MRKTPKREHLVTLHEDPQKQISIEPGGVAARRSGADPPPLAMIQEYGNPEQSRDRTGEQERKLKRTRSVTRKQMMRPTKRRSGQLPGKKGEKNPKGRGKGPARKTGGPDRQLAELFRPPDGPNCEQKEREERKRRRNHDQLMMEIPHAEPRTEPTHERETVAMERAPNRPHLERDGRGGEMRITGEGVTPRCPQKKGCHQAANAADPSHIRGRPAGQGELRSTQ